MDTQEQFPLNSNFVSRFPGAFASGQSIFELAQGCYSNEALRIITSNPVVDDAIPDLPVGEGVIGRLGRLDGTSHTFDVRHYLNLSKGEPAASHIARSWDIGAIIAAGDILEGHSHFNHLPELELIYHLRNGVAHGNRFNITKSGERRLMKYDAYLRWFDGSERFRVRSNMNGRVVLFDFVKSGDVADILTLAAERLRDLEKGILGPDVCTSIFG